MPDVRRITFASNLSLEEVARLLWDERRAPFAPAPLVVGGSTLDLYLKQSAQGLRATANWKRVRVGAVVSADERGTRVVLEVRARLRLGFAEWARTFIVWIVLFVLVGASQRGSDTHLGLILATSAAGACALSIIPALLRRPPDLDAHIVELQHALKPLLEGSHSS